MIWTTPEEYADYNHYLYFASLRIGYHGHQIMLAEDSSPGIDVLEPPSSISDFDTHFFIADTLEIVPDEYRVGVVVHQNTYAWDESNADDFIIYDYQIVNTSNSTLDSVYVALHADCDISAAEGGTGNQAWSRDDLVSYYRDYDAGEFISFMYDGDNPTVPGNDEGGRREPKECAGYLGSRLLYCPARVGEATPTIQSGHGWWDWNSDPSDDDAFADWFDIMADGIWKDDTPSPHDFRFFQKTGPFEIAPGDSIRVVFALGLGEGMQGMRSNLNAAKLLFENDYAYYDLPPAAPLGFDASTLGDYIEFNWQSNTDDDIAGYIIYSATGLDEPFMAINGIPIEENSYSYMPPERNLFYCYITAEDDGGAEGMTSDTIMVSTLPVPPGNLRAIPGENSVSLSWDTNDNVDAYRMYRADISGGPYTQIAEIDHPGDSYSDNDVVSGQTYYYVGTSMGGGYESPYSGEIRVVVNPVLTGRVLLIDDYQDVDEFGNPLENQYRRRFYERWGVYNFDSDVWSIPDSGMVDLETLQDYQAVLFASDGDVCEANPDYTWWIEIGPSGGVLRDYLEGGGHLLAVGSQIMSHLYNSNPPLPGDFDYDWFGIDSVQSPYNDQAWDTMMWFTWAIGAEPGYPDSMKIDVAKEPNQDVCATSFYSLRPGADTLFTWGLWVDGDPPGEEYYQQPTAIIYRPDGEAVTSLFGFSLYFMPNEPAQLTMSNILRDEFGCTFYEDPAPLPPWQMDIISLPGNLIHLTWDPADEDDIVALNIYRAIWDGQFELIATLDPDAGDYVDEDITPGDEYNYKLAFVDFAGQEGEPSPVITEMGGRPSAPENLSAEPGDELVELAWNIPDDPSIVNFYIYRKLSGTENFVQIATVSEDDNSYLDDSVANRYGYYYYLTSNSSYGVESYPSDTVFAYPYSPDDRRGILIVNGVDWGTYGGSIISFYQDEVPSGFFTDYNIWDLFLDGSHPHPEKVLGEGDIPDELINAFSSVVWVGNSYSGDLDHWESKQTEIMEYLNSGGNLLLMTRHGHHFFFEELWDFCEIIDYVDGIVPYSLIAQHPSLTDIDRDGSLSFTTVFDINESVSTTLYEADSEPDLAAGFWTQAPNNNGNFIYLAGRPYRYDHDDLKANVDVMLREFFETQVGIDDPAPVLPSQYELSQNYPNPFNPTTTIRFGLAKKANVNLQVYDVLGRQVRNLVDTEMDAGYHEVIWDGKSSSGDNVSTGIYFYKLEAGDFKSVKKMLMLK
ncbi:MAG: T9SS type A sorting domain-containing protein [candidate division Zixibacteria bacterium]|nr:T9SS type A sorting domain-containing protein [candidate division Zixibacteria bacterium]